MERKPEIISRDIATFERKLAEAGDNAVLKEALNKKLVKLKQELKGGQMSTRQLASNLLGARRKISALSGTEFRALILRLSKKPEYAFLKRYSNQKVRDDMERPAKPVGYRFKGRGNYDKPTPRQIRKGKADGTVYYEARPRRSDVNRVIQLGKGGRIDISDLVIGTDYAIVDFGMGYWLTDWTYQGERIQQGILSDFWSHDSQTSSCFYDRSCQNSTTTTTNSKSVQRTNKPTYSATFRHQLQQA